MKSPWKFLGNLISRGRSAEPEDVENRDATEAKSRSGQSDEALALSSPTFEVSPLSRTDHIDIVQTTNSNEAEEEGGAPASTSAPRGGKRPEMPTQSRSKRGRSNTAAVAKTKEGRPGMRPKRSGPAKTTSASEVAQNARASDNLPSQDGFYTDMQSADEDIQQLRRQLADALAVQNDQLKKMLQRFGVS